MPDTQAAYRGLKPQTALMRAASGMSRTIDRRRPRKLNLAQQAEVKRHPMETFHPGRAHRVSYIYGPTRPTRPFASALYAKR